MRYEIHKPWVSRGLHRWRRSAAIGIVLALAALHWWSLMRFPEPAVDEAWFGNRAWSFVKTGETIGSLDSGVVDKFQNAWWFFPLLPVIAQASALSLASEPSLISLRILSLAMGVGLALAVWMMARAMYDHPTALLALVFLTLSSPFIYSSHLARYDIMAAAVGYVGIALYMAASKRRGLAAGLGGFFAGLATEFHPFAIVIAAALPVLVIHECRSSVHRQPLAWSTVAGLIAGLAVYPALHILPDARSYVALSRLVYGPSHVPALAGIGPAFKGTLFLSIEAFTYSWPLLPCAIVMLALSRETRDRRLALMAITIFVAFTFLVRNKLPYYAILFAPPMVLCMAAAIRQAVVRRQGAPALAVGVLTVALVLLINTTWLNLNALRNDNFSAFREVERQVAVVVKPAESIMGSQTYWFGLSGHNYYSWEQLIYLQRLHKGISVTEALAILRPDVFIRDGHLDDFILDEPGGAIYTQLLRLPKVELESWFARHAALVADFDGKVYGRIRVYRLRWETGKTETAAGGS
jgi:4-amino-4-deoxy-L-arabinose transferase-like glycosyltransferase